MKIKYLGHSCFKLSDGEKSIVIDPYKDNYVPGLKVLRVDANKVICTHSHDDHSGVKCVNITAPAEFEIEAIPSWHDDQHGALRGPNTIYVIKMDGLKIAHLGDQGCALTDEQRAQLTDLDVMMIPVGAHYTIGAEQAAEIVQELQPKVVIPMHYRGNGFGFDVLSPVSDFVAKYEMVETCPDEIDPTEHDGVVIMDFVR